MKAIALKLVGVVLTIIANVLWFLVAVVAAQIVIGIAMQVASILFATIAPIVERINPQRIEEQRKFEERRQAAMEESMKDSEKWFKDYVAIMKKEKETTNAARS